jgi:hypothetical protein
MTTRASAEKRALKWAIIASVILVIMFALASAKAQTIGVTWHRRSDQDRTDRRQGWQWQSADHQNGHQWQRVCDIRAECGIGSRHHACGIGGSRRFARVEGERWQPVFALCDDRRDGGISDDVQRHVRAGGWSSDADRMCASAGEHHRISEFHQRPARCVLDGNHGSVFLDRLFHQDGEQHRVL